MSKTTTKEAATKAPSKKLSAAPVTTPAAKVAAAQPADGKELLFVSQGDLQINDGFNVREEYGDMDALTKSINVNGVKQPLKVRREGKKFSIIDGHRRFLAVTKIVKDKGIKNYLVPVIVESEKESSNVNRLLSLLIYNDGKPLSILEEAMVFHRLQTDEKVEPKDAAKMSGKSVTHVYNCNLLMAAPKSLLDKIRSGEASASLIIEQLKQADGDGEKVEGAIEKAQEKSGKKKITRKNLKGADDKKTFTILHLLEIRESLDSVEWGNFEVQKDRVAVLDAIIKYLSADIDAVAFCKVFAERVEDEDTQD